MKPKTGDKLSAKPSPKPPAKEKARLAARVDGKPLDDETARALWEAFSAHMEEHKGDLAGFAKSRGFASIAPTYEHGRAVLVAKS